MRTLHAHFFRLFMCMFMYVYMCVPCWSSVRIQCSHANDPHSMCCFAWCYSNLNIIFGFYFFRVHQSCVCLCVCALHGVMVSAARVFFQSVLASMSTSRVRLGQRCCSSCVMCCQTEFTQCTSLWLSLCSCGWGTWESMSLSVDCFVAYDHILHPLYVVWSHVTSFWPRVPLHPNCLPRTVIPL